MDNPTSTVARTIQGLVLDVDGVLTNGHIIYSDKGEELKHFHVRDGASIKLLMQQGIEVAIITGRESKMVTRRARELGVRYLKQGVGSKPAALEQLVTAGFPGQNLAAVGDDLQDIDLFKSERVALSFAVADAHPATQANATLVTTSAGGTGVCAEIARVLLQAQDKWPY